MTEDVSPFGCAALSCGPFLLVSALRSCSARRRSCPRIAVPAYHRRHRPPRVSAVASRLHSYQEARRRSQAFRCSAWFRKTKCDVCGINNRMDYQDFLNCNQWQLFRQVIWDHHRGLCHICGGQGSDVHHLTYKYGLFNPRAVILVCRPCHEIWRGRDPVHLADGNPLKSKCQRIAEIARALSWDKSPK